MRITKQQADDAHKQLLFAVGCIRVMHQCGDERIAKARADEAENAISEVMEMLEEASKQGKR